MMEALKSNFALAYILFWKLYKQAHYIFDLPLCMEECLIKLGSVGPKEILEFQHLVLIFIHSPSLNLCSRTSWQNIQDQEANGPLKQGYHPLLRHILMIDLQKIHSPKKALSNVKNIN